jgi:aminobenzoyl-glutamate utilization protein A
MVKGGATEGVDYLVGIHIGMKADTTGSVIAAVNGLMATRKFDIKFTGKPAHAGMNPQLGRNALLAAATAVLNIHAAPQHEEGLSRVNVGSLLADGERNVIPSEAFLRVETRGSNERVEDHVYQHAIRSINGAAQSYGVEFGLETLGRASNANCDLDLSRMIRDAASLSTGVSNVIDILEDYGGCDDFSIMMNSAQEAKAKACFTCIGSNLASGHHQPDFDFDEESLLIGIELLAHAVDLLSNLDCGASRIDRL